MAFTTTHKLVRFDATTAILYLRIYVKDGTTTVETVEDVPVRLPVDISGMVPVGSSLQNIINKAISGMFTPKILEEKERLYRIAQNGGIVANAIEIEALTEEPEGSENQPYVMGYIFDQYGTPQAGVTITTTSAPATTTTNEFGFYIFEVATGTQRITAAKTGYISGAAIRDVSVLTHADITITDSVGVQSTHTVTNADNAPATVTNDARAQHNVEIDFPAGCVVDNLGNPVSSFVIDIANVVVSDPGVVDCFPGMYLGSTGGGSPYPISTYGYMNVQLSDGAGTSYQLDAGTPATVRMPVDPDPSGVNNIPTWRLNETTGVWERKGTAYRIFGTNIFEFEADTFSWWNFDVPLSDTMGTVTLTLTVYDDAEHGPWEAPTTALPTPGVEITVGLGDYNPYFDTTTRWQGRGVSDANGQLVLEVPPGYLVVRGKKGDKVYWGHWYNVDDITGDVTMDMYYYLGTDPGPPAPPFGSVKVSSVVDANVWGLLTTFLRVETGYTGVDVGWTYQFPGELGPVTVVTAFDDGTDAYLEFDLAFTLNLETTVPGTNIALTAPSGTGWEGTLDATGTYDVETTFIIVAGVSGIQAGMTFSLANDRDIPSFTVSWVEAGAETSMIGFNFVQGNLPTFSSSLIGTTVTFTVPA